MQDVQTGDDRRIVPYHTKCDANYSEAETCLYCRAQLAVGPPRAEVSELG